jgi:hypothetical protein
MTFPIYQIEPEDRLGTNTRNDSDGRFQKYWCARVVHICKDFPQLEHPLFKAGFGDGSTSSERRLDWSEKVASELGKLLGLPVAQTELAVGIDGFLGTLSVDYTPVGSQIISGYRFLTTVDPLYDVERADGTDSYNVQNILHQLSENFVGLPTNNPDWMPPAGIKEGADLMVGFLIFDAWISATDRHDKNWEIALSDDGYSLCPTFDHGDSLGAKLSIEELNRFNFEQPKLSESCWWNNLTIDGEVEGVEISTAAAFAIAAKLYPDVARIWLNKLAQIEPEQIDEIFDRIPEGRITEVSANFAKGLIEYNRTALLKSYQLELDSDR